MLPCNGMRVVSSYDSMCSVHCGNLEIVFCLECPRQEPQPWEAFVPTTCLDPRLLSPVPLIFSGSLNSSHQLNNNEKATLTN